MKETTCHFKGIGTMTDTYDRLLIKAEAKCKDIRTGENIPLTLYFVRNMDERAADTQTVGGLVAMTILPYGFEYIQMNHIETEPVSFNAEELWRENHDQARLPY